MTDSIFAMDIMPQKKKKSQVDISSCVQKLLFLLDAYRLINYLNKFPLAKNLCTYY